MDDDVMTQAAESNGNAFPVTRWTRVSRLRGDPESKEGRRALEELCTAYWQPLYAFARRKGQAQADAQDLVQGFFAKVLQGSFLAGADKTHGRMRTYLLTAFTRYMADEWDKTRASKRGGGLEILSLDFDDGERRFIDTLSSGDSSLEQHYQRDWAASILERTGLQLQEECERAGKRALFEALRPLVAGGDDAVPYEQLTGTTGMSIEAMRQTVRRLRLRFREILRQLIADTLDSPTASQIDDELRALRAAL
jgi:DNA-directed RNA polymerase specialized sigma24 family protein